MSSIRLTLDLIGLRLDPEDHAEVACPGCHGDLAVHQPDERRPERLLGTCPSCSAWYQIDATAQVMVRLPDGETLRGARTRPSAARVSAQRPVTRRCWSAPGTSALDRSRATAG
jgi:uncharacterized protein YbaR (Trm112 family)